MMEVEVAHFTALNSSAVGENTEANDEEQEPKVTCMFNSFGLLGNGKEMQIVSLES